MLNIGVLVSGGGTNLQVLMDAEKRGEIPDGKISLVVSSRKDAYALQRATDGGIPTVVCARKDYGSIVQYSNALIQLLRAQNIDLVVMAGFLTITSPDFVAAFPNRIINVHPALLPAFGGKGCYGLRVHEKALARGVKITGATVHFVNEICDGGPIILQKAVMVQPKDTPEALQKRVMEEAEWVLLPKAVALFCQGRLRVSEGRVLVTELPAAKMRSASAAQAETNP